MNFAINICFKYWKIGFKYIIFFFYIDLYKEAQNKVLDRHHYFGSILITGWTRLSSLPAPLSKQTCPACLVTSTKFKVITTNGLRFALQLIHPRKIPHTIVCAQQLQLQLRRWRRPVELILSTLCQPRPQPVLPSQTRFPGSCVCKSLKKRFTVVVVAQLSNE